MKINQLLRYKIKCEPVHFISVILAIFLNECITALFKLVLSHQYKIYIKNVHLLAFTCTIIKNFTQL